METFKPAFKIAEFAMLIWGVTMLIPLSLTRSHAVEIMGFSTSALCCLSLAWLCGRLGGIANQFKQLIKPKAMFLVTFINWIILAATGTLPFLLSGLGISFTDALFESVSGITTTGSTVLTNLDGLPSSLLLWRSITQWVGGIGIILMAVAVLPFLRVGGMRLFKTESSEWVHIDDNKISDCAIDIALVYTVITTACLFSYRVLGMDWFDSINHALTTVSTGGFSTADASFGKFQNPSLLICASIFMLLGGFPFLLYVTSLRKRQPLIFKDRQVRLLIIIVLVSAFMITIVRQSAIPDASLPQLIPGTLFNLVSIVTTTGYASEDYTSWGSFSVVLLGFLMFCGACSGSTSGGVKIFRFQLLSIFMREHTFSALHPNAKQTRCYNERPVSEEVLVASLAFFFFVIISWFVTSLLLSLFGLSPVTATSAALTALMNVGPGLGDVIGPSGNFSTLPDSAKYVLVLAMLLGRLEYLALIIVFTPEFWKW